MKYAGDKDIPLRFDRPESLIVPDHAYYFAILVPTAKQYEVGGVYQRAPIFLESRLLRRP